MKIFQRNPFQTFTVTIAISTYLICYSSSFVKAQESEEQENFKLAKLINPVATDLDYDSQYKEDYYSHDNGNTEKDDTSSGNWNGNGDYYEPEDEESKGNYSTFAGALEIKVLASDTETERDNLITDCQCGIANVKKNSDAEKIVGGTLADLHAWPWMAALVFVGDNPPRQFCGGSLINNQYILTAAHCVQDIPVADLSKFRVYLGTNTINGPNSTAVPFQITSILSHPSYDRATLNFDMALIKLAVPIIYNSTVSPICLGQKGAPHIGRGATVAGWGSLTTSGTTVNNLRNVDVKVLPNGSCATSYAKVNIQITPLMICATNPNKDSCKGDSGGPLFAKRNLNAAYDQIGVVSFGQECGKPQFPGVYARVGRFMKFIRENTKDATYCTQSFNKP